MYELLGASLALAGLLTVNAIASLIASGVWRMMSRRARLWSAVTRSRLLFALRVFPTVGALFLVFGIIAPSYLIYEPAHTGEEIGPGRTRRFARSMARGRCVACNQKAYSRMDAGGPTAFTWINSVAFLYFEAS